MSIATLHDVESSLLRPLTPTERTYADALLDRAESLLTGTVPQLAEWADTDHEYRASVAVTEANMVARVLRNPTGIASETEGNYQYRVNLAVASGLLAATIDELSRLRRQSPIRSTIPDLDAYARGRHAWRDGVHPFLRGG